jgi:hypothetical protein
MKKEIKTLKEKDRDLWYKKMGNKTTPNPEDEYSVGLMEYFELMDDYGEKNG